jgi:hypothetical protein
MVLIPTPSGLLRQTLMEVVIMPLTLGMRAGVAGIDVRPPLSSCSSGSRQLPPACQNGAEPVDIEP